jgi:agmatine deiminase
MALTQSLVPEWAPQSALMITWPHDRTDWADSLASIEQVYLTLATEVVKREPLLIVCRDREHRQHIRNRLTTHEIDTQRVILAVAGSNDIWIRDYGPQCVCGNGIPSLLDFRFNGWGGRYLSNLDDALNRQLYDQGHFGTLSMHSLDMVLEGGSIDSDGHGQCLTTSRCLLSASRNAGHDRATVERRLGELLGIRRVLWLDHGFLLGDDTDGHVDNLARFCDDRTIAYATCENPEDEHYRSLQRMKKEIMRFRDRLGRPYRLVPLPLPAPLTDHRNRRLPASYLNFAIINGAVLVPQYHDPADKPALARLRPIFAPREIVGIDCLPVIQQCGSLHCLTMQLPQEIDLTSC